MTGCEWTGLDGRQVCQFTPAPGYELIGSEGKTYCQFHLPLTGPGTKEDWEDNQRLKYFDTLKTYLKHLQSNQRKAGLKLNGLIVPGSSRNDDERLTLADVSFVEISGADIAYGVELKIIDQYIDASHSVFRNDLFFDRVRLKKTIDFSGSTFASLVFKSSVIAETRISFDGATFPENGFRMVIGSEPKSGTELKLSFENVKLYGDVSIQIHGRFVSTSFCPEETQAEISLELAGRENVLAISGKNIGKNLSLIDSGQDNRFDLDNCEFNNVSFGFQNAPILYINDCIFDGIVFNKAGKINSVFGITQIGGKTSFKEVLLMAGSQFTGQLTIEGSDVVFEKDVYFDNASFHRGFDIDGATFLSSLGCRDIEQRVGLSLTKCKLKGSVDFSCSQVKSGKPLYDANFRGTTFQAVDFGRRQFEGKTDFRECVFETPPEFLNSKPSEVTFFPPQKNFKRAQGEADYKAYRVLRQKMEETRDRFDEGKFFALEQRAFRSSPSSKWNEKTLSWLYEQSSNYGQDWFKPLKVLLLLHLVAAILFYNLGTWTNLYDGAGSALGFSFRQIVSPFYVWRAESGFSEFQWFWPRLGTIVLSIIESVSAIGLIASSVLAVRWRFRRG